MDDLQFLDFSKLTQQEKEFLENILKQQQPTPCYQRAAAVKESELPAVVVGEEQPQPQHYAPLPPPQGYPPTPHHHHHMPQVVPGAANVFVSNVTANVNVHGFPSPPTAYLPYFAYPVASPRPVFGVVYPPAPPPGYPPQPQPQFVPANHVEVPIADEVVEKEEPEIKAEEVELTPTLTRQRQVSLSKQEEEEVPSTEAPGMVRKSYAQMAQQAQDNSKPFAMIHPTVHHRQPTKQPPPQPTTTTVTPEKTSPPTPACTFSLDLNKAPPEDHDINLQRLGEFLVEYRLDHTPLRLQPRGLTNRSNYCYVNAILQALTTCSPFYNLIKAIPPTQLSGGAKSRTPIIDSMVKFVNEFSEMSVSAHQLGRKEKAQATKDGTPPQAPEVCAGPAFEPTYVYKMLSAMPAAFPVEGRQEDAEEFLSCLLNGLNDEMLEAMKQVQSQNGGDCLNGDSEGVGVGAVGGEEEEESQTQVDSEWTEVINAKNKSVVTRRADCGRTPLSAIFQGQMRSRVIRAATETSATTTTTANVQPFFTLQLDVEKANSVEKALELLVGKDEVFGATKEVPMFTQTSIEELPLILILHLKCFHYKLQVNTAYKIIKTLEFPIDLKIDGKHLTSKSKSSAKDRQYKLLAVVYHDGKEATKGHYITDVWHVGVGCWLRYDDATVRPVTPQQVLNPRSPRVPYLLYYRRCDTMQPVQPNR